MIVERDAPLAASTRRLLARAIEGAIPAGCAVALAGAGAALGSGTLVRLGAVVFVTLALALFVANAYLLVSRGQTLAKLWLGLRVIRPDGSLPGAMRAFVIRELVVGLITLVPVVGALFSLVDVAVMLFSGRRRSLHDEMADTLVVDIRADQRP